MWVDQHISDLGRWRTVSRPSSGELSPYVRGFLGAHSSLPTALIERRLPGLAVFLVINFGGPHRLFDRDGEMFGRKAWVIGLQTQFRLSEAAGLREFMVVQLSPIGAHLILRLPMDEIADRIVPLADIDLRLAARLTGRVSAAPDWPGRFDAAEAVLAERLADQTAPALVVRALARLAGGGAEPEGVRALATAMGCSHRHLVAQFHERVGVPPKTVARIARFNRTICAIDRTLALHRQDGAPYLDRGLVGGRPDGRGAVDWADLAAAHGFYDQAHFINDFRAFAGVTPTQYLAAVLPPPP